MPDPGPESYRAAVLAEARRRFGAARAEALDPELTALAADLARIAETPLPDDGEPGFFLLEE
jgi:hypothetical protein